MNPNQTLVAVCNAFKKLTLSLFFLCACSAFAQVGVGTQNPQTALHVAGANANADGMNPGTLAAGDGVIVTRVTDDLSGGSVTTGCTSARQGAMVYSTNGAGAGYYTCNGTNWVALGGGATTDWTPSLLTLDASSGSASIATNTDNNLFIVTTGVFGTNTLTLPTAANNSGRRIIVVNSLTGGASVSMTGHYAPGAAVLGQGVSRVLFCDGTAWY